MSLRGNLSTWCVMALCVVALVLVQTRPAQAQGNVTTGTISGQVLDPQGSSVPKAKVLVKNEATGIRREATSDENGRFVFAQIPVGTYETTVEATGFKKQVVHETALNVGATQELTVTLQVGTLDQTVEVTGESIAPIETTKAEVSGVIKEIQVRELPLNQRSFTALVTQEPGLINLTNASGNTTQTPTSVAFAQGSQISANGQISQSMAYLVDGVNINNSGFGAPGTAAGGDAPGVEAIQEFKVLRLNYSAAYGGSAGAVVSFATRSGTNRWIGSVYEFLRNDALDARRYFDQSKPPYKRNQFGAALGGPILKDKMFLFGNYEALIQRLTTTEIGTVPSTCARNSGIGGSGVGCPGGVPMTVTGCTVQNTSGVCTAHGPVAISPGVQAVLTLYPLQNGVDFGNGIAEHRFLNQQPVDQHFGVIKYDYNFSSKDAFSARYSATDAVGSNAYFLPTYGFDKSSRLQNVLLKWSHTFTPTLVNTLSFGFNRSRTLAATGPRVPVPPAAYTGNATRQVVGTISVGSATSGNTSGSVSTIGLDNWGPFHGVNNSFPLTDDATWTRGNHTVRFGGMISRRQWNWRKGNLIGGGETFNSLNDLLAGNMGVLIIRVDGASPSWGLRTTQYGWYVEDSWRIRSNFTLTVGLRHEFQAPILSEVDNKLGNWKSQTATSQTIGQPYQNYSKKQFSPRIGIAWDPFKTGKTVVRAGYGLFYDFIPLEAVAGELSYNDPQPTLNAFFGDPIAPGFLPKIEFPSCTSCTARTGYPGLLTGVLDPVRAPTSNQWHLEVERELFWNLKLTGTYTGAHTYNIMRGIEGNHNLPSSVDAQGPNYSPTGGSAAPGILSQAFTLYAVVFDAHTWYNAGTLGFSREFSNGLLFSGNYTFTKTTSESDTNNSGAILAGNATHSQIPDDRHNDKSESMLSVRHRFTFNSIYELPFGKGRKYLSDASGLVQAFFGGWSINNLIESRSGFPFSVLAGFGITNVGDNLTFPDRTNILRPNPVIGDPNQYFDPRAYALQPFGRIGNAARNTVRGPGYSVWDFGLGKKFNIRERMDLAFRAEFFNVLNHTNFDLPFNQLYTPGPQVGPLTCNLTPAQAATTSCNPQAGRITRTVGVPRQVQFALKFSF